MPLTLAQIPPFPMASQLRVAAPVASSPTQLENDADVCGNGAPTHVPRRATQTYINTANGTEYHWYNNAWH